MIRTCVLLLLLVLAVSAAQADPNIAGQKPWNFVFLLIDDYGWTDASCFGSDLYETPNVDRLAREGMKFDNAYSACTVCSPTRAASMTGKYPARLHVTDWISGHVRAYAKLKIPEWTQYLALEETTLAEALKPSGYFTAHIGKWHLGDEGRWPCDQGFDVNVAGNQWGAPATYYWPYESRGRGMPNLEMNDENQGKYLTDRLGDEAVKLLRAHADKPFYLNLPTYQVHTPIQPKKEYVPKYEAKLKAGLKHTNPEYAAMVQSMDELVGKVLRTLDELKLADRTVVFFTGDNGGLSHIYGNKRGPTDNSPLRLGKGSAYEGGVRVPLIVRWPGVAKAGSVCHEPVITVDYYPTMLEIAGAKGDAKHNATVDGTSLVPVLKNPDVQLDREAIYWHYPHYHPGGATPYGAIRAREWKLIEFYEDNHVELYNLKDDVGEQQDLAAKMPEKANQLRAKLHAWRKAVGAQMPTANPDYDAQKDREAVQSRGAAKPVAKVKPGSKPKPKLQPKPAVKLEPKPVL